VSSQDNNRQIALAAVATTLEDRRPDAPDWSPRNSNVIIAEQRSLMVYVNPWGQAVIRQEASWDQQEDDVVVVDHAHLPGLIKSLREIADQPLDREPGEDG